MLVSVNSAALVLQEVWDPSPKCTPDAQRVGQSRREQSLAVTVSCLLLLCFPHW